VKAQAQNPGEGPGPEERPADHDPDPGEGQPSSGRLGEPSQAQEPPGGGQGQGRVDREEVAHGFHPLRPHIQEIPAGPQREEQPAHGDGIEPDPFLTQAPAEGQPQPQPSEPCRDAEGEAHPPQDHVPQGEEDGRPICPLMAGRVIGGPADQRLDLPHVGQPAGVGEDPSGESVGHPQAEGEGGGDPGGDPEAQGLPGAAEGQEGGEGHQGEQRPEVDAGGQGRPGHRPGQGRGGRRGAAEHPDHPQERGGAEERRPGVRGVKVGLLDVHHAEGHEGGGQQPPFDPHQRPADEKGQQDRPGVQEGGEGAAEQGDLIVAEGRAAGKGTDAGLPRRWRLCLGRTLHLQPGLRLTDRRDQLADPPGENDGQVPVDEEGVAPVIGVQGGAGGVQVFSQVPGPGQGLRDHGEEALVGMQMLALVPVQPCQAKGQGDDHNEGEQSDPPTLFVTRHRAHASVASEPDCASPSHCSRRPRFPASPPGM